MKIVYLYSELSAYNVAVLSCLVETYGAQVHVVSWDEGNLKPYVPPPMEGVTYYRRSEFTSAAIRDLTASIQPDLVYISGWMDSGYLPAAKALKARGVPVVTGFDDVWVGSLRQRAGALIFPIGYRKYFTHAWVSGPPQYEFARRLGFQRAEIIFDLLTCDYRVFDRAADGLVGKRLVYPKVFLYVGNFRAVKGTDILARAFERYRDDLGGRWKLVCVGNGEMRADLEGQANVEVRGFTNAEDLVSLCDDVGAFVLPSRREQWGVVVHEFAAAGLPLLLADNVGAASTFLIEGFNGLRYGPNSSSSLAEAMLALSSRSDGELLQMAENSRKLARRITPEMSAASFVSVLGGVRRFT